MNLTVVSNKDEEEQILLEHENLEKNYYEDPPEVQPTGSTQKKTKVK